MKRTRAISTDLSIVQCKCRKYEALLQDAIKYHQKQWEELQAELWALQEVDYDFTHDDGRSYSATSDEDGEDSNYSRSTCSTENKLDGVSPNVKQEIEEVATTNSIGSAHYRVKAEEDTESDSDSDTPDIWSFPKDDAEAIQRLKESGTIRKE